MAPLDFALDALCIGSVVLCQAPEACVHGTTPSSNELTTVRRLYQY